MAKRYILFLALAIAAGFAGGWLMSPSAKRVGGAPPMAPRSTGLYVNSGNAEESQRVVPTDDIRTQLNVAFASGSIGYAEMRALMAVLARLSPATISEFSTFFRAQPMKEGQMFLWRMFFSAWGDLDPQGAIAFIDSRFEQASVRRFFYAAVIDSWQGDSMEDAFEFALTNFVPATRDGGSRPQSALAVEYLRTLAVDDPQQALGLARRLGDEEFVLELTARRISQLSAQDRNEALEVIETLSGDAHLHAASQFIMDWASQDPSAAAQWLSDHADDPYNANVFLEVARNYITTDPAGALGWIDRLPDLQQREEIRADAVAAWARTDPQAAIDWLREAGGRAELDSAVVALGHHLAKDDPGNVIEEWVPMITDAQRGNELLSTVSSEWQRSNPQEFTAWIEQSASLPAEVKQRLIAREVPESASAYDGGERGAVPAPAVDDSQGRDQ